MLASLPCLRILRIWSVMADSRKQMDISKFHYEFGIHSNIPECCVKFYVEKVKRGEKNIGMKYRPEYFTDIDKYVNIRYVTCNECHAKVIAGTYIPNKIHSCRLNSNNDCTKFREAS